MTDTIKKTHSQEAEQSVIGALLLDDRAFDLVSEKLKPEHFFNHDHKLIYTEISRQLLAGKRVDMITIYDGLKGEVDLVTLNQLAQYVPSAANIKRYAQIVIDRSKSRDLLDVSATITELATEHQTPINDRIEQAQAQLSKLVDETPRDEWVGAYEGMVAHTQTIEDRANGLVKAMSTGLNDIDDFLDGGLRGGGLYILAARPSMGKTAMAMTMGLNMARDYSVGFLSMEMPHTELRDRQTAMLGRVGLSYVARPTRGAGLPWDRVIEGVEKARQLNFYASDQSGLNINQVRSKARNLKRIHGLNVLIVDYLGLMSGLDAKQQRAYQLEEITRGLKTLAKELDIAVVCLAQVNRKVEERANQAPHLSDLRDSGAIEQDADVVMFISRPIQGNPNLGAEWSNYARMDIAKNRQGRCGVVDLWYEGEQVRFDEWQGEAPRVAAQSNKKYDL